MDAFQAGLSMCPSVTGTDGLRLDACFGAAAGVVQASGQALDVPENPARALLLATVGARVGLRLWEPLWLVLELGGGFNVLRDKFMYFQQDGTSVFLHRPGFFAPTGSLGLGVDFL